MGAYRESKPDETLLSPENLYPPRECAKTLLKKGGRDKEKNIGLKLWGSKGKYGAKNLDMGIA